MAILEPTTQKLIDQLSAAGGPPLYTLSPTAARAVLTKVQEAPVKRLPAGVEDTTFPVGPTGTTRIRIVRPAGAKEALPVVMWFHGGGWILGDKETHDRLVREIANGTGAAVVFVDYERSPEARYAVALEPPTTAASFRLDEDPRTADRCPSLEWKGVPT